MGVVSYAIFLHDTYFLRVHLRFDLRKFTRFSTKGEFYKNRLYFCTFKLGGGGWKVSRGEWKVDGGGWRWVEGEWRWVKVDVGFNVTEKINVSIKNQHHKTKYFQKINKLSKWKKRKKNRSKSYTVWFEFNSNPQGTSIRITWVFEFQEFKFFSVSFVKKIKGV